MGVVRGSSGHHSRPREARGPGASGDRGIGSSDSLDTARLHPSAIELHIEELVLHGFQAGDRRRIGDAVEQELARLLASQGVRALLAAHSVAERLDAGAFAVRSGAKPHTIGTQLARTVYQRLASRGKRAPSTAGAQEGPKIR